MNRLLVFLACTGVVCCILAALFGVGDAGRILWDTGAVLLLATGATAACGTLHDPLKGPKK